MGKVRGWEVGVGCREWRCCEGRRKEGERGERGCVGLRCGRFVDRSVVGVI